MDNKLPDRISVKAACAVVGGDKPISRATYYRAVRAGILPQPDRITSGAARVDSKKLLDAIAARVKPNT